MDRLHPVETEFGDCQVTPDMILEAIQDVFAEVGEFLSDWVRRVDQRAASRSAQATPDALLRERIEEFESMKSFWEAKRKSEEHRLQEEADQLTAAWLRLEDEQRAILQIRESSGGSIRERNIASQPATHSAGVSQAAACQPPAVIGSQAAELATVAAAAHRQSQVVTHHQLAAAANVHPGVRVQYQQPSQLNPDYPAASDVAQWNEQLAAESGSEYPMRRQLSVGGEMSGHAETVGRVDFAAGLGADLGQSQTGTALVSSTRETAVRQFQRLRREIESSRSNSPQS